VSYRTRFVGIVVIGRNEGERLRRCLASVVPGGHPVVYVDSGSADGSAELARSTGAIVVELDPSIPFTAARGRNAGFRQLMEMFPAIHFVQFVDGDCELTPGWLDAAAAIMNSEPKLAAVRGNLLERNRDCSVYARLCNMEWRGPVGDICSTGGIALFRVDAFQQAGGFDAKIVAGEEAELCRRLLAKGCVIRRIDAEMGTHDCAMTRFVEWWKRTARSGHSFAESAVSEAGATDRNRHAVNSIMFWTLLLPALVAALVWPTRGLSLLLLLSYLVLWFRVARSRRARGDSSSDARLYATFCVIGKFAQARGVLMYHWNQSVRRKRSRLIEYKSPATTRPH